MNGKDVRYSMICVAIMLIMAISLPLTVVKAEAHAPMSAVVEVQALALPTIIIEVPVSGATIYNSQTTVSGKATGNLTDGKVELSVNGGPWLEAIGTQTWGLQITMDEGNNSVVARVTDSKGNTAEANVTIISDPVIPPQPHVSDGNTPGFEAVFVLLGAICLAMVRRSRPNRGKSG